jgi:hypothetical protein
MFDPAASSLETPSVYAPSIDVRSLAPDSFAARVFRTMRDPTGSYLEGMAEIWSSYRHVGRTVEDEATSLTNTLSNAQASSTSVSGTEEDPQSIINTLWDSIEKQHIQLRSVHTFQKKHLDSDVTKESLFRQFTWLYDWAVQRDNLGERIGLTKKDTDQLESLYAAAGSQLLESYTNTTMLEYHAAVMYLLRIWEIHSRNGIRGAVNTLNQRRTLSSSSMLTIPEKDKASNSDADNASVQSSAESQNAPEEASEHNDGGMIEKRSGSKAKEKPRHKRVSQLKERTTQNLRRSARKSRQQ